jgi:hypothetical protein
MNAIRIRVTSGECTCHGMPATHVHHSHFPEVRAVGHTSEEAARYLAQLLNRSLASVGSRWRREPLEAAIVDVEAFLDELARGTANEEAGPPVPPRRVRKKVALAAEVGPCCEVS